MGASTKAIISKGTTIDQIESAMSNKYGNVEVHGSHPDFMRIVFNDGEKNRILSVLFDNYSEYDYGIAGVLLSLGATGNSIEVMKYLCETFGGYIDENDCDEEGFYPINHELYSQGKDFTELDEFRHKVIAVMGYENLEKVMNLFEEFKNI